MFASGNRQRRPSLAPDEVLYNGLTFSPDGNYVFFSHSTQANRRLQRHFLQNGQVLAASRTDSPRRRYRARSFARRQTRCFHPRRSR